MGRCFYQCFCFLLRLYGICQNDLFNLVVRQGFCDTVTAKHDHIPVLEGKWLGIDIHQRYISHAKITDQCFFVTLCHGFFHRHLACCHFFLQTQPVIVVACHLLHLMIADDINTAVAYRCPVQFVVLYDAGYHSRSRSSSIFFREAADHLVGCVDSLPEKCRNVELWFFFHAAKSLYHHLDRRAAGFSAVCHTAHTVTYQRKYSGLFVGCQSFAVGNIQRILLVIPVADCRSRQCGKLRHFPHDRL